MAGLTVNTVLFDFFALLAIAAAILMVTRRNVVHSAIFLITALLATAGIFLLLQAEFLFAVQIILYVGGIMVLYIFIVMLVNLDVAVRQLQFNRMGLLGTLLAVGLGAELLLTVVSGWNAVRLAPQVPSVPQPNTETVAQSLFGNYMLPFEIASVLLLVAMIGAVVMAKRRI